jgi:hypothetical protein
MAEYGMQTSTNARKQKFKDQSSAGKLMLADCLGLTKLSTTINSGHYIEVLTDRLQPHGSSSTVLILPLLSVLTDRIQPHGSSST